jgi:hypothetical protein
VAPDSEVLLFLVESGVLHYLDIIGYYRYELIETDPRNVKCTKKDIYFYLQLIFIRYILRKWVQYAERKPIDHMFGIKRVPEINYVKGLFLYKGTIFAFRSILHRILTYFYFIISFLVMFTGVFYFYFYFGEIILFSSLCIWVIVLYMYNIYNVSKVSSISWARNRFLLFWSFILLILSFFLMNVYILNNFISFSQDFVFFLKKRNQMGELRTIASRTMPVQRNYKTLEKLIIKSPFSDLIIFKHLDKLAEFRKENEKITWTQQFIDYCGLYIRFFKFCGKIIKRVTGFFFFFIKTKEKKLSFQEQFRLKRKAELKKKYEALHGKNSLFYNLSKKNYKKKYPIIEKKKKRTKMEKKIM